MKSPITSHVLNTATGKPAQGICISLFQQVNDAWQPIHHGITNDDGRVTDLLPADEALKAGTYKLTFSLTEYFAKENTPCFYPTADIVFNADANEHYHIPLLVSPFGYSTYRGS